MKKGIAGFEGISFGVTSGVITILVVLIGLAATGNRTFALIGIIIVGIADALSDSVGMYVSQESEYVHSGREIFKSAVFTFFGKVSTATLLILPLIIFSLYTAVVISFVLGLVIVGILGYYIAKGDKRLNIKVTITKHVLLAAFVAVVSYIIGTIANNYIH